MAKKCGTCIWSAGEEANWILASKGKAVGETKPTENNRTFEGVPIPMGEEVEGTQSVQIVDIHQFVDDGING